MLIVTVIVISLVLGILLGACLRFYDIYMEKKKQERLEKKITFRVVK